MGDQASESGRFPKTAVAGGPRTDQEWKPDCNGSFSDLRTRQTRSCRIGPHPETHDRKSLVRGEGASSLVRNSKC